MSGFLPVYKFLEYNGPEPVLFHSNSGREFVSGDGPLLLDELDLYRLCDLEMQDYMVSGVSGGLLYYESVSGTDDGNDIVQVDFPEAWDRLCENAFGTPFRGQADRTIPGLKQFTATDLQRAVEESFPQVRINGIPIAEVTRTLSFWGASVSGVPGPNPFETSLFVSATTSPRGKLLPFWFTNNGNTSNKWLFFGNSSATSDTDPLIVPYNMNLVGLTFVNSDDDRNCDIEIYKNGVLFYTWEIRAKRLQWDSTLDVAEFNGGDRMSIFVRRVGNKTPNTPIIEVILRGTDDVTTSGGFEIFPD